MQSVQRTAKSAQQFVPPLVRQRQNPWRGMTIGLLGSVLGAVVLFGVAKPSSAQLRYFGIDYGDPRVREFQDGTGAFLGDSATLYDGNGFYSTSTDVAFYNNVYYTINGNGIYQGHPDTRVRKFNLAGAFIGDAFFLHEQDGTPVAQAQTGIGTDGTFFYSIAAGDTRVRQYDETGLFLRDVTTLKEVDGSPVLQPQTGIDFDGTYFYTVAVNDSRVRRFNMAGFFLGDVVLLGGVYPAQFSNTGIGVYREPTPAATGAPEPGSLALLGMGLVGGVGFMGSLRVSQRRQNKN